MANAEHLKILKRGVSAWNKWRVENPGIRPDLTDADLRDTDLIRADLGDADLRGADLRDTLLGYANLGGSDLGDANLSGAILGMTLFTDSRLSGCRGLSDVRHEYSSGLDPRTLARSGRLSRAFLQGCGWPDEFIDIAPNLWGPIQFYSAFISYSHEDKSFARRLHDQLQGQGIRCWLDEHQLLPGDDMLDQVDRGIRIWDKVLLCCSEHALESPWVNDEIDRAFAKERKLWKDRKEKTLALIPLNLDGYLLKGWESSRKSKITSRLAADFRGWEKDNAVFEAQFERVVKALRADEGARAPDPDPKL